MKNDFDVKMQEFKEYISRLEYLRSTIAVLSWDASVNMPKKSVPYRGEVLGYLSGEEYKLETSDKMKEFIDYFSAAGELDDVSKAMLRTVKKQYDMYKKVPEEKYTEYNMLISNAQSVWEDAKNKSDYSMFKPYLKKIIEYNKEFADCLSSSENKYDTLLDIYEPGITVEKLDEVFGELRDAIVELLRKIEKSGVKVNDSFFRKKFPEDRQEAIGRFALDKMGFDFDAGRLDTYMHPFTTNFNNKDVRITTFYRDDDVRSSIFSCIHEGGHAIYEQDVPDELQHTLVGMGASMGIHESQSRFYENIVGRSKAFCKFFYPEMLKTFPELKGISFEDFYKAMNIVEPSLVRTEADELTYSLHIIIRYEIEKAFMSGKVTVDELPELWNKKYKEYLGIEPENDAEGILQDVHWAGGMIGYFPSYALGNIYGAQFLHKMVNDVPDIFDKVENGDLDSVHQWLKENIHKYGAVYEPQELIKKVTGEELNAKYFIQYLNNKYSEIYNLK